MKKFISIILATILLVCTFSLIACKKNKVNLEIEVDVYNIEEEVFETQTLNFTLNSNLAPEAVKKLKSLIKDGYYDGAVFYRQSFDSSVASQVMLGEYKLEDGEVVRQEKEFIPEAEFLRNGTKGSNMTHNKGAIGFWRSWDYNGTFYNSGYSTSDSNLYILCEPKVQYDGYFCQMGTIVEEDLVAFDLITSALTTEDYFTSYTVYYTLEDEEFVSHIIETDTYNEQKEELDVYTAEDGEDTSYDPYTVSISVDNVVIKNIKIG